MIQIRNEKRRFEDLDVLYNCVDEKSEWSSWESLWFGDQDFHESESIKIDEANVVTFNKKPYPRDGWAVIMAGGAGLVTFTLVQGKQDELRECS